MSMRLPHLDQLVPLERGEAALLARALAVLVRDVTHARQPVQPTEMLTLAPLASLLKKLLRRQQQEQHLPLVPGKAAKPWKCRVSYDQLVVVRLNWAPLQYCGLSTEENLLLVAILGKFHQKSLNLTQWIKF